MKFQTKPDYKTISISTRRILLSAGGVLVNVILSFIMYKFKIPLYLDTIGTIGVAAISGMLFPAICTAVATNAICAFFYEPSIYLSFFNAFIAIFTVAYFQKYSFKSIWRSLLYVLIVTLISSVTATLTQYAIYGQEATNLVAQNTLPFLPQLRFLIFRRFSLQTLYFTFWKSVSSALL